MTLSSVAYHTFPTPPPALRYADTAYACSYTIASTLFGMAQGNVVGVMLSALAILLYVHLSHQGSEEPDADRWHAWVHIIGAIGLSTLPIYTMLLRQSRA